MLEEAFFATQLLTLSGPDEQTIPDETTQPLADVNPAATSVPSEQEQDADATQPRLKAARSIEKKQEQVPSISTRLITHYQPLSQRPSPVLTMCVSAPPDWEYLDRWDIHLRPLEQSGYPRSGQNDVSCGIPSCTTDQRLLGEGRSADTTVKC